MPFTNPIVAGTTLIRTAIKSPNYVAGVSGWAINKDGSAEFNDVTVRGELLVSDSGGSYVRIYNDGVFGAIIAMQPPDKVGHTYFPAVISSALDVDDPELIIEGPTGGGGEVSKIIIDSDVLNVGGVLEASRQVAQGDLTAVSAFVAAETSVLSAGGTFKADSSYKITFTGSHVVAGAVSDTVIRFKNGGQQLSVERFPARVVGRTYGADWTAYFQVGAATIARTISLTLQNVDAGATSAISASATSVAELVIEYDGINTKHPNSPVLT